MRTTLSALILLTLVAAPAIAGRGNTATKEEKALCEHPALRTEERMNCRSQMSSLHTASEHAVIVEVYEKMIADRTETQARRG
jgi:hypothetical protein